VQPTIRRGSPGSAALLACRRTSTIDLALFLLVNSGDAHAPQGDKVYFAEVAFTGDAAIVEQAHPHTVQYQKRCRQSTGCQRAKICG